MYKKPNNPNPANGSANDSPEPRVNPALENFEQWLELQLAELETKYESFTTIKSIRDFFNPKSR